jgi:hypothetical protein
MIHVSVTPAHIERGARSDANECPIAWAMVDAGLEEPYVGINVATWGRLNWEGGRRKRARLPRAAQLFIGAFDRDEEVEPFEFDLEVEQ